MVFTLVSNSNIKGLHLGTKKIQKEIRHKKAHPIISYYFIVSYCMLISSDFHLLIILWAFSCLYFLNNIAKYLYIFLCINAYFHFLWIEIQMWGGLHCMLWILELKIMPNYFFWGGHFAFLQALHERHICLFLHALVLTVLLFVFLELYPHHYCAVVFL